MQVKGVAPYSTLDIKFSFMHMRQSEGRGRQQEAAVTDLLQTPQWWESGGLGLLHFLHHRHSNVIALCSFCANSRARGV